MRSGSRRLGNLILLIGGYGLGQGTIFLAQTWLISRGQLGLVANFGVNFYIATLAIMLVDFGSTAVLARETAAIQHARTLEQTAVTRATNLWSEFWAIVPSRVAMAVAVVAAGAISAILTADPFARAYAIWAWPAVAIWAFNATGLLDGLRLSGMNGVAGALPFILSGVSLALVADQPPAVAGALLGAALSTGYLLAVTGQMLALGRSGHAPRWVRPTRPTVIQSARSGFAALLATLPGQIYFRFQILLAGAFLGEAGVALFLYAKQIVIGFAQLIGFLRRIEFPDLVSRLKGTHGPILREIMAAQRLGTVIAAAASVLVLVVGLTVWLTTTGSIAEAGLATALFAPIIITSGVMLSLTQALTAQGNYHWTALVMIMSSAIAALLTFVFAFSRNITGFAAADAIANLLAITLAIWVLKHPAKSRIEVVAQ
ncbi:hypothetical protein GCM10009081_13040 [Brevundimonas nasdae]